MTYTVNEAEAGLRLDAYISTVSELSRSAAAKLIEDGLYTRCLVSNNISYTLSNRCTIRTCLSCNRIF